MEHGKGPGRGGTTGSTSEKSGGADPETTLAKENPQQEVELREPMLVSDDIEIEDAVKRSSEEPDETGKRARLIEVLEVVNNDDFDEVDLMNELAERTWTPEMEQQGDQAELQGLSDQQVFDEEVPMTQKLPEGARVIDTRFVRKWKADKV